MDRKSGSSRCFIRKRKKLQKDWIYTFDEQPRDFPAPVYISSLPPIWETIFTNKMIFANICTFSMICPICPVVQQVIFEINKLTFGNYLFSKDIHTTKVTCYHDFNTICTYIWLTKKLTISKSPFSLWSILNRIEVIRKGGRGGNKHRNK